MQCFKLSPNLREQTIEVKDALKKKDKKKALEHEVKKLVRILAIVRNGMEEETVKIKVDSDEDDD